jgi:hypothetical protein
LFEEGRKSKKEGRKEGKGRRVKAGEISCDGREEGKWRREGSLQEGEGRQVKGGRKEGRKGE